MNGIHHRLKSVANEKLPGAKPTWNPSILSWPCLRHQPEHRVDEQLEIDAVDAAVAVHVVQEEVIHV